MTSGVVDLTLLVDTATACPSALACSLSAIALSTVVDLTPVTASREVCADAGIGGGGFQTAFGVAGNRGDRTCACIASGEECMSDVETRSGDKLTARTGVTRLMRTSESEVGWMGAVTRRF